MTPPEEPLHICEIGGGNGTCLRGVLDYLKENAPEIFKTTTCTSIDVSSPFTDKQRETLSPYHDKVEFVTQSIFDWSKLNQKPGFVIALELLDNLPHDKLVLRHGNNLVQTNIVRTPEGKLEEQLVPISDPVILEILTSLCKYYGLAENSWRYQSKQFDQDQAAILWCMLFEPSRRWEVAPFWEKVKSYFLKSSLYGPQARFFYLPTGSWMLLKKLRQFFPYHDVIFADFDGHLTKSLGTNAPLIQKTIGNLTLEEDSYLHTKFGDNDIIFPTNFATLSVYWEILYEKKSEWMKTKTFMKDFADKKQTRTKSGYNPLIFDFENTSFFLGMADYPYPTKPAGMENAKKAAEWAQ
jgi:hypothetical protein